MFKEKASLPIPLKCMSKAWRNPVHRNAQVSTVLQSSLPPLSSSSQACPVSLYSRAGWTGDRLTSNCSVSSCVATRHTRCLHSCRELFGGSSVILSLCNISLGKVKLQGNSKVWRLEIQNFSVAGLSPTSLASVDYSHSPYRPSYQLDPPTSFSSPPHLPVQPHQLL